MNTLKSVVWAGAVALAVTPCTAANPDGGFSGPAALTDFQTPGKPSKEKNRVTLEFSSANSDTTMQINDDPILREGTAFQEGRYLYVQYRTGAALLSGRLLIKGSPGVETSLSGILTSNFNGYVGFHEYKVNLKREP